MGPLECATQLSYKTTLQQWNTHVADVADFNVVVYTVTRVPSTMVLVESWVVHSKGLTLTWSHTAQQPPQCTQSHDFQICCLYSQVTSTSQFMT